MSVGEVTGESMGKGGGGNEGGGGGGALFGRCGAGRVGRKEDFNAGFFGMEGFTWDAGLSLDDGFSSPGSTARLTPLVEKV